MEFHQQHRRFAQAEFAVAVDHAHGGSVQQFHTGNGYAQLNGLNHGVHRIRHAGEGAGGRPHRLWQGVEAQGDFGEDAQRALAAHHQAGEVVTGSAFFGTAAGAQQLAAGVDHLQRQHVLAHGAVAHGIGSAGAGSAHAANAGIRAGVNGEEQPFVLDGIVERLAAYAGLHGNGHILGVDAQYLLHLADIQADAATHRQQMPL